MKKIQKKVKYVVKFVKEVSKKETKEYNFNDLGIYNKDLLNATPDIDNIRIVLKEMIFNQMKIGEAVMAEEILDQLTDAAKFFFKNMNLKVEELKEYPQFQNIPLNPNQLISKNIFDEAIIIIAKMNVKYHGEFKPSNDEFNKICSNANGMPLSKFILILKIFSYMLADYYLGFLEMKKKIFGKVMGEGFGAFCSFAYGSMRSNVQKRHDDPNYKKKLIDCLIVSSKNNLIMPENLSESVKLLSQSMFFCGIGLGVIFKED